MRDLLLGREPKDYDVATDATPDQVMNIFPETYAVGAQFGVVLVPLACERIVASDRRSARLARLRSRLFAATLDIPMAAILTKCDSARIRAKMWQRRDFTINGMLLDPVSGEVLDFVGGRKDLKAGIVRAIGDPARRFAEDKLRMLRAVRFAARFEYSDRGGNFRGDAETGAADSSVVSRERVRDELTRMLTEEHARRAFLVAR